MSNPTATRWLVDTDDFSINHTDYALPDRDSAVINQELRSWDFRHYDLLPWTYLGYAITSDGLPCYPSAIQGALLYADVTGTPEHKQLVKELRLQNRLSADAKELAKQQQPRMRDKLVPLFKPQWLRIVEAPEEKEKLHEADADDKRMRHVIQDHGPHLHPETVRFILGCQTVEEKTDVLNLFSGEGHVKHPRPTLMIVDMFDDAKAVRCGQSSGYVIAYDFLSNQIVIKHWNSSLDHHPFEDSWFATPQSDGVSYMGSPKDLWSAIVTRKGLVKGSPTYGFGLLTRYLAGCWMSKYFDVLGFAMATTKDQPHHEQGACADTHENDELPAVLSTYAAELNTLDVPGVKRDGEGQKQRTNYRQPKSITQIVYGEVLDYVERWEVELQEFAFTERKAGKEKIADNLARFYDGVSRAAKTLLLDPEAEFCFE
ncbi:hypothetical protein MMC16_003693 [Acarospora aff. strigata]|nr:hypothetical protein [Acarospora aff. strigata]